MLAEVGGAAMLEAGVPLAEWCARRKEERAVLEEAGEEEVHRQEG